MARRGMKTNIADLRRGDWIEHEGKTFVVQQINSAHSGRGSRQFLVPLTPSLILVAVFFANGRCVYCSSH